MANQTAEPGWYHATGDPEGTQRYWDGTQWSPEPVPAPPALPQHQPQFANSGYSTNHYAGGPIAAPVKRGLWDNFRFVVFENYANFNGRARRREYWLFTVAYMLILFVLAVPLFALVDPDEGITGLAWFPIIVGVILGLALWLPGIAVAVRRFHDTNRSGAWYLVTFIPWIGGLIMLALLAQDGTVGANQYGPDPKGRG